MHPHGPLGLVTGAFCWTLVHHGPDAIIYTDRGGLIRFWNSSAERIFGYAAWEAIGQPLAFVIAEEYREQYRHASISKPPPGNDRYSDVLAFPAQRKDGTCIWIELAMFPDRNGEGHCIGMATILRDITKRVKQRQQTVSATPTRRLSAAINAELSAPAI
jgi:PAS domain S-box-containing protein